MLRNKLNFMILITKLLKKVKNKSYNILINKLLKKKSLNNKNMKLYKK